MQKLEDNTEFFYVAMSVALSNDENSIIPDALTFMTPDQIVTFISVFGGSKVKVPTPAEFSTYLFTSLAVFYRIKFSMPWKAIQDKLEISDKKMANVKKRVEQYTDWTRLHDIKIPF